MYTAEHDWGHLELYIMSYTQSANWISMFYLMQWDHKHQVDHVYQQLNFTACPSSNAAWWGSEARHTVAPVIKTFKAEAAPPSLHVPRVWYGGHAPVDSNLRSICIHDRHSLNI